MSELVQGRAELGASPTLASPRIRKRQRGFRIPLAAIAVRARGPRLVVVRSGTQRTAACALPPTFQVSVIPESPTESGSMAPSAYVRVAQPILPCTARAGQP
jgi:hypothetical protein